jgi:eukaryotic-like serine/threonine-protein kinase
MAADRWTGRLIDGRYVVEGMLGQGGMGVVLRARHQFTHAHVALKMLQPALEMNADLQERFLAEARASSAIGHPGIVQVLDAGKTPEGELYLAMELLTGNTLRRAMYPTMAPQHARRIVLDLLDALAAAHARGIVHRDLKPENVFLAGPAGIVKLLDFGIAKVLQATRAGPTSAGMMLGTLAYMAPEQLIDASSVDHRADLWAVGVMLYELTCGQLPYRGAQLADLMHALATREPDPITAHARVGPAVEQFFARALARDRGHRFQSAREMAQALAALPGDLMGSTPEPWGGDGDARAGGGTVATSTGAPHGMPATVATGYPGTGPAMPAIASGAQSAATRGGSDARTGGGAIHAQRAHRPTPAPPAPHVQGAFGEVSRARSPTPAPPHHASSPPPHHPPSHHPPSHHPPPGRPAPRGTSPWLWIGLAGGAVAIVIAIAAFALRSGAGAGAPSRNECEAGCAELASCGLALPDCVSQCEAHPLAGRCLVAGCERYPNCVYQLLCGAVPSGSSSCLEAQLCVAGCKGNTSCSCQCTTALDPEHTAAFMRLNGCSQASCGQNPTAECLQQHCMSQFQACAADALM